MSKGTCPSKHLEFFMTNIDKDHEDTSTYNPSDTPQMDPLLESLASTVANHPGYMDYNDCLEDHPEYNYPHWGKIAGNSPQENATQILNKKTIYID
jgi:hypothetical protein